MYQDFVAQYVSNIQQNLQQRFVVILSANYAFNNIFCFQMQYCPVCEQQIRNSKTCCSSTLAEFIQNFVENNDSEQLAEYKSKILKLKLWKKNKSLQTFKVGMKIDVRDSNFIWCQGIIIRIISRIGETTKILKIRYQDTESEEQQIKVNSVRLAKLGFYTARNDIPKYNNAQNFRNNFGTE